MTPTTPTALENSNDSILREVLFSPATIADRQKSYDRFEMLRKSEFNPIFNTQKPWEESGVNWGSVIRSEVDGKFKFFYGAHFPGA